MEQMYMNIETGSVAPYVDWYYTDQDGEEVNAVDLKEVTPVFWNGSYWEQDEI